MKILFLTSAHNSLSQRLLIELTDRGRQIAVTLATSDEAMLKSVEENAPDLIIAPMLKAAIPEAIYSKHTCFIVHPRNQRRSRAVVARLGDYEWPADVGRAPRADCWV